MNYVKNSFFSVALLCLAVPAVKAAGDQPSTPAQTPAPAAQPQAAQPAATTPAATTPAATPDATVSAAPAAQSAAPAAAPVKNWRDKFADLTVVKKGKEFATAHPTATKVGAGVGAAAVVGGVLYKYNKSFHNAVEPYVTGTRNWVSNKWTTLRNNKEASAGVAAVGSAGLLYGVYRAYGYWKSGATKPAAAATPAPAATPATQAQP